MFVVFAPSYTTRADVDWKVSVMIVNSDAHLRLFVH